MTFSVKPVLMSNCEKETTTIAFLDALRVRRKQVVLSLRDRIIASAIGSPFMVI